MKQAMNTNNQLVITEEVGGAGMTHYHIYTVYEYQMEEDGKIEFKGEFLTLPEAIKFAEDFGAEHGYILSEGEKP